LRNDVMHGRAPFPTYRLFKEGTRAVAEMTRFIGHLEDYREDQARGVNTESAQQEDS
jgi:hypothetical protein